MWKALYRFTLVTSLSHTPTDPLTLDSISPLLSSQPNRAACLPLHSLALKLSHILHSSDDLRSMFARSQLPSAPHLTRHSMHVNGWDVSGVEASGVEVPPTQTHTIDVWAYYTTYMGEEGLPTPMRSLTQVTPPHPQLLDEEVDEGSVIDGVLEAIKPFIHTSKHGWV